MRIPKATYRFQFHKQFRLTDARSLVPYLQELGISHVYASPLFKATPGSQHGYDVCDFNQINPEIGTEEELEQLVQALREHGMGLVLDIVPNHMGIASPENRWWWDVLTHGRQSRFASHFDINWEPADETLRGKVLAPVLGERYETLLVKGEFKVLQENNQFVLGYHEHRFPLAPETIADLAVDAGKLPALNSNPAALDHLIRRQHYQLAFYEEGDARLNYRRFFTITSLAAVRAEDEKTFDATHALLRRWLERGFLDGVRVDHPDGLRDPDGYLGRLRALAPAAWIVVEKILEPGEMLPATWPIQGTTGYDFLNKVNGAFIDESAARPLTEYYASFTGEPADYPALLTQKKHFVLERLLLAELDRIAGLLNRLAAADDVARTFPPAQTKEALAETVACFPVYRSYLTGKGAPDAADIAVVKAALHLACERRPDLPPALFAFVQAMLLNPQAEAIGQEFVSRFQQLTGAAMAKGAEDTACYCFNRFISLNEVGSDPKQFGINAAELHQYLEKQNKAWPHTMLGTSTHDTKRAEDVRARLDVLSEMPEEWIQTVSRWSDTNRKHRTGDLPDRNAEYLFYQTLAGAWPLSEERALAYMEKAIHEAKQHTDWTRRNEPYEGAMKQFISQSLRDPAFTTELDRFTDHIAEAGAVNSLAQTLIKLTAPGVPDFYQGSELWDFSLVDPDNRRPVDYAQRQRLLAECRSLPADEVWRRRAEGLPKLWLINKTLLLRTRWPDFNAMEYLPMPSQGPKADHAFAFARGGGIMVVVPRFWLKLQGDWQHTKIALPTGYWYNEFTGEVNHGDLALRALLRKFPVALLTRMEKT